MYTFNHVSTRARCMAALITCLACAPATLLAQNGAAGAAATGRAIGDPVTPDPTNAATLASDRFLALVDAGRVISPDPFAPKQVTAPALRVQVPLPAAPMSSADPGGNYEQRRRGGSDRPELPEVV